MEPLDPQVINLTKAIRQAESGGKFDARSKDGSYGAYQFIKPTWDATAKKYGVNAEWEKATPQQQNEVAYKQIKEWKDKGLNVGQIASSWNAGPGRPNAYLEGHTGVNSSGVKFDTPGYAKKVAEFYQQFKGNPQAQPEQPVVSEREQLKSQGEPVSVNPEKGKPSFFGGIGRDIVKPFARLATNLINADQVASGRPTTQPLSGEYLGEVKPVGQEGTFGQKLKDSLKTGVDVATTVLGGGEGAKVAGLGLRGTIKQATVQGLKEFPLIGAIQGASTGLNPDATVGKTLLNTGLGALGGAVSAPIAGVTTGLLGKGINALTGRTADIERKVLRDETVNATSKALGLSGKRPASAAKLQPEQYTKGLATIRKYNPEINVKDSENIFDDTLNGLLKAKEQVFKTYDDISRQAGNEGLTIDLAPLEKELVKYTQGITTSPKRARAQRLITELRTNFPEGKATPSQMQEYIKLLNEELGGVSGGAERGAIGVVSQFTKDAREAMDKTIARTGKEYQFFRDEYASLKSIEDSIVRQYQKAMRKKGGGLSEYADMIANAEMLSGIVSFNPALIAKSAALRFGSKYIKSLNDPETWLRKAFEGIDQLGDEFTPKATPRAPQLMLPAPKAGSPKSQVNTPIKLGSRSQSTIDAEEIARLQNQRSMKNTSQTNLATSIPMTTASKVRKNPIPKAIPQVEKKVKKLNKGLASKEGIGLGALSSTLGLASLLPKKTIKYDSATDSPKAIESNKREKLGDVLMMLESSGGTNKKNADRGEMKWLVGLTEDAIKELKRVGRLDDSFNKNNRNQVINAGIDYFKLMQERNPKLTPGEVYVDKYWTQWKKDKNPQEARQKKLEEFNKLFNG